MNLSLILLILIGATGILVNKRSLLITLISIEMMLYGIDLYLIYQSLYVDDIVGQMTALYILTIAASESAIALGLVVLYYKYYKSLTYDKFSI